MSNNYKTEKNKKYSSSSKIPYDDSPILRRDEVVRFPRIYPSKYEDFNLDNQIKQYKKNLKLNIQEDKNARIKEEYKNIHTDFGQTKEKPNYIYDKNFVQEKTQDDKKAIFDSYKQLDAKKRIGKSIEKDVDKLQKIKTENSNIEKNNVENFNIETDFNIKTENASENKDLKPLSSPTNHSEKEVKQEPFVQKQETFEKEPNLQVENKNSIDLNKNNSKKDKKKKVSLNAYLQQKREKEKLLEKQNQDNKLKNSNENADKNSIDIQEDIKKYVFESNIEKSQEKLNEKASESKPAIQNKKKQTEIKILPEKETKDEMAEKASKKHHKEDVIQIQKTAKISGKTENFDKNTEKIKKNAVNEKKNDIKNEQTLSSQEESKIIKNSKFTEIENKEKKQTFNQFSSQIKSLFSNQKLVTNFLIVASAIIFLINIVLAGVLIFNIKTGGKKYLDINYNTINVNGNGISTSAVQSAWQSSVCVGAGGNVIDESSFYSKTSNRGSGVILSIDDNDNSAYILTCEHVISGHENAIYVLFSCYLMPVKVNLVGKSVKYDIAVLKVKNVSNIIGVREITTYDSRKLSLGESVFSIGNSLSSGLTVSSGIVSAQNKQVSIDGVISREIQTDIAINPGNSGGGLFNSAGEFVGLINAKLSTTNSGGTTTIVDGVSYAIPGTFAINLANSIIKNDGDAVYADIGVSFTHAERFVSMKLVDGKYIETFEVRVGEIASDSCAKGLLKKDDIIKSFTYTSLSGETKTVQMYNEFSYEDICFDIKEGSSITFEITRPLFSEEKTIVINSPSMLVQK